MSYDITTVMKRLDGSTGTSKATFGDGEVTFEQSDTPSPYIGFRVEIVEELPATGENGVIYLIEKEGETPDIYNEYIWIETTESFEFIGTTQVDLSNYYTKAETDTAIQTAINSAILTALNTAV